jgi:protein-S-isoprenylcysteine O-methyltransferase Ste14
VIQPWLVTALPVMFLIVLFGGGSLFRRRNIDMDGEAPINRIIYLSSKYLIVIIWVTMVLHSWGISLSFFNPPNFFKPLSSIFWIVGFLLLFSGRFNLGNSFRIGSPKESTTLKMNGLFRFSRNPMYLGVFATLLAPIFYTLNPLLLLIVIFIIAVHHKIVLAEEKYLKKYFGEEYVSYCGEVRRYI